MRDKVKGFDFWEEFSEIGVGGGFEVERFGLLGLGGDDGNFHLICGWGYVNRRLGFGFDEMELIVDDLGVLGRY